jgi:hypothetical protein
MLSEKVLKRRSWRCIKRLKYLPIKQYFKNLFSSNLLLSILVPLYAIFGFELPKVIGFENNKPPLINEIHKGNQPKNILN